MKHFAWIAGFVVLSATTTGCVERRFVITSDPPGAIVLRNNERLGASPVDDFFVYYGNYHFTLIADGYETLQVDQDVATPWYEYFPLDFVSENLVPWKIEDVRRFNYKMQPVQMPNSQQLLTHGEELRGRGKLITPAPVAVESRMPTSPTNK